MSDVLNSSIFDCHINDIVIIHQNIRSVRKNFDNFLLVLQNINRIPDIIILSEIWIEASEVDQDRIPGYSNVF